MIVLYQCRFVHCNKCTTLLRGVDSGRYCKCVGMGMWEWVGVSLKLPLEINSI